MRLKSFRRLSFPTRILLSLWGLALTAGFLSLMLTRWREQQQQLDQAHQRVLDQAFLLALMDNNAKAACDLVERGADWHILLERLHQHPSSSLASTALLAAMMYTDPYYPERSYDNPYYTSTFASTSTELLPEDPALIHKLLVCGAKPTIEMLCLATALNKRASARLLLDYDAPVNAQPKDLEPPMNMAAYFGDMELVQRMLAKGARINATRSDGETALYAAVWSDQVEMIRLLISKGANVNVVGDYGITPLMRAAQYGSPAMVRLLLQHKARVDIRNEFDESVLKVAHTPKIIALLKQAGAKE